MKIYDRKNKTDIEEVVYGDFFVNLAYGSTLGHSLVWSRLSQKLLSHFIGFYQSTSNSKQRIDKFTQDYSIQMNEFEIPDGGYKSFNDFFIRKLKPKQRPYPEDVKSFGSPAEGRLSAFEIQNAQSILTIKGYPLSIETLLGSSVHAQKFTNGYSMVFRLCPVDYHRFHFPDFGIPTESTRLGKNLHSVNPLAQLKVPNVFLSNERQVSYLESENFGTLAFIEVGALGVGKIHQSYSPNTRVYRGQEKGYFSFGGSTVIVLSQQGRLSIEADILEKSRSGTESLIRLGEVIGRS